MIASAVAGMKRAKLRFMEVSLDSLGAHGVFRRNLQQAGEPHLSSSSPDRKIPRRMLPIIVVRKRASNKVRHWRLFPVDSKPVRTW